MLQHLRERTVTPDETRPRDPSGDTIYIICVVPLDVKPENIPAYAKEDIFMNKETNERIRRAEVYSTKCRMRELRKERRRSKMVLTASKIIIILAAVLLGAVIGGGLV